MTLGKATVSKDAAHLNPLLTHEFRMKTAAAATNTTAIVNKIPKGTTAKSKWIVFLNSSTPSSTEIRKVNTLTAGNIVGFTPALAHDHPAGEAVLWLDAPTCNVKWWGAAGDGTTDDSTALGLAAQEAYNLGATTDSFGVWYAPSGVYMAHDVTLYAFVQYMGDGVGKTLIKLPNSANSDIFVTDGFDGFSVLGSANGGLDYSGDGVPTAFTLRDLRINGNRSNNTSGSGLKIYARLYSLINVTIVSCVDYGLYSELEDGYVSTAWEDRPEAYIDRVNVSNCGDSGIVWRGPHDMRWGKVVVASCGQTVSGADNIVFETVSNAYGAGHNAAASGDVEFIHSYGAGHATNNTVGRGCYIAGGTKLRCDLMVTESSYGHCLEIDSNSNGNQIGVLRAYRSYNDTVVLMSAPDCLIGNARITDNEGTGGIEIEPTAYSCKIGVLSIDGRNHGATGLYVNAGGVAIGGGDIFDYSDTGGIGLHTSATATRARMNLNLEIKNCETGWKNDNNNSQSIYNIAIYEDAGQTGFSGSRHNSDDSEAWNVTIYSVDDSEFYVSDFRVEYTDTTVDLTDTTLQTISVPYVMVVDPRREDITVGLRSETVGDWAVGYITWTVDTTNKLIVINVKLSAAAGSGTANLLVRAKV